MDVTLKGYLRSLYNTAYVLEVLMYYEMKGLSFI